MTTGVGRNEECNLGGDCGFGAVGGYFALGPKGDAAVATTSGDAVTQPAPLETAAKAAGDEASQAVGSVTEAVKEANETAAAAVEKAAETATASVTETATAAATAATETVAAATTAATETAAAATTAATETVAAATTAATETAAAATTAATETAAAATTAATETTAVATEAVSETATQATEAAASAAEMSPADLLKPENFSLDKVLELVEGSDLGVMQKTLLKTAIEKAKDSPELLQAALEQVKAALKIGG